MQVKGSDHLSCPRGRLVPIATAVVGKQLQAQFCIMLCFQVHMMAWEVGRRVAKSDRFIWDSIGAGNQWDPLRAVDMLRSVICGIVRFTLSH